MKTVTETSELEREGEPNPPKLPPASEPAKAAPEAAKATATAPRRVPWSWLLLLLTLIAGGLGVWQLVQTQRDAERRLAEWRDVADQLEGRLTALDRQLGSERERSRVIENKQAENQGTLRVMREELLGMTERAALLEDAVSRLTAQREGADQVLRLSEIEFLLSYAEQRLMLFSDLQAAIKAMELAARSLDIIEEPAFAPLKQTLAAELEQLGQVPSDQRQQARRRLSDLLLGLEALPPAPERQLADAAEQSRWRQLLDQLITVRRLSDTQALLTPLERATRVASLRLQLGLALAALEQRRSEMLKDAVKVAQQDYQALFDPKAPAVVAGQSLLDELELIELNAQLPSIGTTLRELRAIRAARSVNAQAAAAERDVPPAPIEVESQ